jgi:membrane associated rhomboid family serine protease
VIPIRDSNPSATFPFVTIGIIVACAAVWLFELTLADPSLTALFDGYGIVPATYRVTSPLGALVALVLDPVPFIGSIFLHGGWLHVVGNLWILWIFGDNVEDKMGHGRFLIFYLLCGLLAGAAHVAMNPASAVPTIGASGAISGVMGAYMMLFPRARVLTLIPIFVIFFFRELPAVVFLFLWFLFQFFQGAAAHASGLGTGVAFWAHIGGFVAGAAGVWIFAKPQPRKRRIRKRP